jgi:protein SCO1/2
VIVNNHDPGSQWKLFTAKDDKAPREIANLLDIKYKKMENGMDYDHSFVIAVLSADGVVKGRQVGADKEPKDLAKFIP